METIAWKDLVGLSKTQLSELRALGYAYLRQGHYATAHTFFKALTLLEPESAYDWQTLGALLLELQKPQEALEVLEMALQLDRSHAKSALNRASALLELGYKKPAQIELNRLVALGDPKVSPRAEALLLTHF